MVVAGYNVPSFAGCISVIEDLNEVINVPERRMHEDNFVPV